MVLIIHISLLFFYIVKLVVDLEIILLNPMDDSLSNMPESDIGNY
jgi:hypothetical protein